MPSQFFMLLLLPLLLWTGAAQARPCSERPGSDVAQWYAKLLQPDNRQSCCGEGDSYYADEVHVEGDKVIAVISDSRDDNTLCRLHEPNGARYVIPPNKMVPHQGNPTGHRLIFLAPGTARPRSVLCFVDGTGG